MTTLFWTEERIKDAIRLFVQENDRLPTQVDFESEDYRFPCHRTVRDRFGSWSAGIESAGFKPRYRTQGEKSGWSPRTEAT